MNARYAEAADEPVQLWDLPDVTHTAAISEVADEYEQRVIGHFDRSLLRGRRPVTSAVVPSACVRRGAGAGPTH